MNLKEMNKANVKKEKKNIFNSNISNILGSLISLGKGTFKSSFIHNNIEI